MIFLPLPRSTPIHIWQLASRHVTETEFNVATQLFEKKKVSAYFITLHSDANC